MDKVKLDEFCNALLEKVDQVSVPRLKISTRYKEKHSNKETEVANVIFSDWQLGHRTESFNSDIARKRVDYFVVKSLEIINNHRKLYDINELNILLLGDFIQNEMPWFVDLSELEDITLNQMVRMAIPLLLSAINEYAKAFSKVNIYCVRGNHGRVSNASEKTNFDDIIYTFLTLALENVEHVNVNVADAWYMFAKVFDYNILLTHGDSINVGSYGVPDYGIMNAMMRWQMSMPKKWNVLTLGHFHIFTHRRWNGLSYVNNGTLVSDDEYVRKRVKASECCSQVLFGSHEKFPVSWLYEIELSRVG